MRKGCFSWTSVIQFISIYGSLRLTIVLEFHIEDLTFSQLGSVNIGVSGARA